MTQKRKVGPGGGDFALNPNRFGGGGGGKSIVTGRKSTVSPKAEEKLKTKKKRGKRDWSDVGLKDKKKGMAEKFLKDHGFRHSDTPGKSETYTYDKDGKIKAFSGVVNSKTGKKSVSQKTFDNPTLKSLRDWMGY
jgi:hypothetical protein